MTRRQLLQSAVPPLAALAARRLDAESAPDVKFPTEPRARLAVASYPFRKFLDPKKGSMTLLDFPKMVVDKFGVPGIEPLDEHFPSTGAPYLKQLSQALAAAGSHVVNIAVGRLGGSFYDTDANHRKTAIESARRWINVAGTLGAPGIRVHIQSARGSQPDVDRAADSLAAVAVSGEQARIVVSLENDDPRSEDAFFIVKILEKVNSPWLRALPDFCNSMILGKGDQYNYDAVTAMFARAYSICHVKDSEDDDHKHFTVDIAKTFAIAKAAHYRGYFSMEWDADGDPYSNTQRLVDLSLRNLA